MNQFSLSFKLQYKDRPLDERAVFALRYAVFGAGIKLFIVQISFSIYTFSGGGRIIDNEI